MNDLSRIKLTGLQVKSFEKAQRLAYALNIIEEECGIHNVKITFKDFFVCPWIDFKELDKTPMEDLVRELLTNKIKK